MSKAFKLPDLGEGIQEGEVLSILVSPGDTVEEGDPIMEVETDKAAVEIPSPFTARVEEIKVKVGDTVQVGDVLITFSDVGEAEEEKPPEKEKKAMAPEAKKPEEKAAPRRPEEGPVPASPATRRLARELEVDLHDVSPTGPGGRVTSDDVKAFAEKPGKKRPEEKAPAEKASAEKPSARPLEAKAPTLPDFTRWGEVERIPLRSIRRATAKQMALSWSQIPHVHNQDMVDMTRLEEFRMKHKEEVESRGGKLTFTVFAMKAAGAALKRFPRFNASLDAEAGEILIKKYFHIGVAAKTDEGLLVPVIRDVDRKSITELAVELNDLISRTRERKVKPEDIVGGEPAIAPAGSRAA